MRLISQVTEKAFVYICLYLSSLKYTVCILGVAGCMTQANNRWKRKLKTSIVD